MLVNSKVRVLVCDVPRSCAPRPAALLPVGRTRSLSWCLYSLVPAVVVVIELEMNCPAYGLDLASQSPVGDFEGNIGIEKVAVGTHGGTETMRGIDDHYALKVEVLSPLPKCVTVLAVLDPEAKAPRQITAQSNLRRLQLRSGLGTQMLRIG